MESQPSALKSLVADAEIYHIKNYLSKENADIMLQLLNRDEYFRIYNLYFYDKNKRQIVSALNHRKSYWFGDYAQSVQTPNHMVEFEGMKILVPTDYVTPYKFIPEMESLKNKIETEFGCKFNSCLVGKFDTPANKIGYHTDASPNLGPDPQIASVSFGAGRWFDIKKREGNEHKKIFLEHGDLLIMKNGANLRYKHSVPVDLKCNGANFRINLTFRNYTYYPEEMKIEAIPF